MRLLPATQEMYKSELVKYFSRMTGDEILMKAPDANIMAKYLKNARYRVPAGVRPAFSINADVFFVINSGIEYDLPHTLGFIIILPENSSNLNEIITHELVHIYFRNYRTEIVRDFCKSKNIKTIERPRLMREITNPDTYYKTCLLCEGGAIFVALIDYTKFFLKKYYFTNGFTIRTATCAEIKLYDLTLPYEQNEHPEEMLAELITRAYFNQL